MQDRLYTDEDISQEIYSRLEQKDIVKLLTPVIRESVPTMTEDQLTEILEYVCQAENREDLKEKFNECKEVENLFLEFENVISLIERFNNIALQANKDTSEKTLTAFNQLKHILAELNENELNLLNRIFHENPAQSVLIKLQQIRLAQTSFNLFINELNQLPGFNYLAKLAKTTQKIESLDLLQKSFDQLYNENDSQGMTLFNALLAKMTECIKYPEQTDNVTELTTLLQQFYTEPDTSPLRRQQLLGMLEAFVGVIVFSASITCLVTIANPAIAVPATLCFLAIAAFLIARGGVKTVAADDQIQEILKTRNTNKHAVSSLFSLFCHQLKEAPPEIKLASCKR